VVRLACRVDLSHFRLWGVTNGIGSDLHGNARVRVRGTDMGFIARVGPTGCMAWHMCRHWTRVLRGNVPSHHLPGYGCVGLTRTRQFL
jgi:hypothetical protein